jgi:hypothetical protein
MNPTRPASRKMLPNVGVAVDVCLWPGVPQLVEAGVVLDVHLAGGDVRRRELVAVGVEDRAQPLGRQVAAPAPRHFHPRSHGESKSGILEPGMEQCQLLEGDGSSIGRHAPVTVGERASRRRQVFEQQDEGPVLGRRCAVRPRDAHVHGRGEIGVEVRLALAHEAGPQHVPVGRVDRWKLHEQRRRTAVAGRIGQADTHPLVGGKRMVEDRNFDHLGSEHLR